MEIAIVLVSWTIGSLLLGFLLGRLFSVFAARRRAEAEMLASVERIRIVNGLSGQKPSRPEVVETILVNLTADPAPKPTRAGCFHPWALLHRGRIQ